MAARILISDVNGSITEANTVWVQRVRDSSSGEVTEQIPFHISARYTNLSILNGDGIDDSRGEPSQDIVYVLAVDTGNNNNWVIIKKNTGVLNNVRHALSVMKEIRFFRKMKKKFLHFFLPLQDIWFPTTIELMGSRIEDTYLVYRYNADMNFYDLVASTTEPEGLKREYYDAHFTQYQLILVQLLLVNLYLLSQRIEHREFLESNIFLTVQHQDIPYKLQIFSVGSYRLRSYQNSLQREVDDMVLRNETSLNRKYTPPESILGITRYENQYDMWSIGCLFGKLLAKKDLFDMERENTDEEEEEEEEGLLDQIVNVLGDPIPTDVEFILDTDSAKATTFRADSLRKFDDDSRVPAVTFQEIISDDVFRDLSGFDLLSRMLKFNPEQRISPEQALGHDFFHGLFYKFPALRKWVDEIMLEFKSNKYKEEEEEEEEDEEEMISPNDWEVVTQTLRREKFLFFHRKRL